MKASKDDSFNVFSTKKDLNSNQNWRGRKGKNETGENKSCRFFGYVSLSNVHYILIFYVVPPRYLIKKLCTKCIK